MWNDQRRLTNTDSSPSDQNNLLRLLELRAALGDEGGHGLLVVGEVKGTLPGRAGGEDEDIVANGLPVREDDFTALLGRVDGLNHALNDAAVLVPGKDLVEGDEAGLKEVVAVRDGHAGEGGEEDGVGAGVDEGDFGGGELGGEGLCDSRATSDTGTNDNNSLGHLGGGEGGE